MSFTQEKLSYISGPDKSDSPTADTHDCQRGLARPLAGLPTKIFLFLLYVLDQRFAKSLSPDFSAGCKTHKIFFYLYGKLLKQFKGNSTPISVYLMS